GDPSLITIAGARAIGRADTVIYDHLASPELLRLARRGAELIYAGTRGGGEKSRRQPRINRMLIEKARKGQNVVRLKGGDPFVFGRGGEEAEALARANIRFEIIPGVSSAIAAPAYAGIPVTHRDYGSFVVFATGHEDANKSARSSVPWSELGAAAKAGRGTIVILMATRRMRAVLEELREAGLSAATPAAAIQSATTAAQNTVTGTIAKLADRCERAGLEAPSLVVVGECARLRERLKWFERKPLFGRRIVVTRAGGSSENFSEQLRDAGAETIQFPTIDFAPPGSYATLDRAICRLSEFDWIVFTSATGVEWFIARLKMLGSDIRDLANAKIAAIGPATANRLSDFALRVAATPKEYRAEALISALGTRGIRDKRFLIPCAAVAREILPEALRKLGAREVVVAPAYRTIEPKNASVARIRALLTENAIDLVTFTSSSTVENFAAMVHAPIEGVKAGAIGPITAATARRLGFRVVVQPRDYTTMALGAAIRKYLSQRG
ncbi:MAG TPA: uroporphyrinogen-III C-methyltransferase, partial [Candidatus Binataceae bacterium]|nr:uroporphyrinogen-III C-methyltransferase [Candidatus Binataceae bacterium]